MCCRLFSDLSWRVLAICLRRGRSSPLQAMYNGYHSASASNRRDEEAAKVILPVALLVAIGASRVFFVRRFRTKVNAERAFMARGLVDGLVAIGCRIFRPFSMPSIVPYWDLSTRIITWMVMSRWVPKESDKHLTIRQAFSMVRWDWVPAKSCRSWWQFSCGGS